LPNNNATAALLIRYPFADQLALSEGLDSSVSKEGIFIFKDLFIV
jgi:hypothetical protein